MKPRNILIAALGVIFAVLVVVALLRELEREEAKLASSLSGVVEVAPELIATGRVDIVKTDRMVLFLVDPVTRRPVALRVVTPLVPPQTIEIGQGDSAEGETLSGSYLLVGITDKDGEIFKVTPGEVYGRSPGAIPLGTERVKLMLTEPFRGSLFNEQTAAAAPPAARRRQGERPQAPAGGGGAGAQPEGPAGSVAQGGTIPMEPQGAAELSIRGEIRVSAELKRNIQPADRLVILLFDPELRRPVASKIIPHTFLPQRFSISVPPEAARPGKMFDLRILTDKDQQPFNPVPGEVIGRSKAPIPLGTSDLVFELDAPYQR